MANPAARLYDRNAMGDHRCDKCGFLIDDAEVVDACPNCGISTAAVGGVSPKEVGERHEGSLDKLFDVGSSAAEPRQGGSKKARLKGQQIPSAEQTPVEVKPLAPAKAEGTGESEAAREGAEPAEADTEQGTLELEEGEQEELEEELEEEDTQEVVAAKSPGEEEAEELEEGPLSKITTLDLGDEDLEEVPAPPPRPSRSEKGQLDLKPMQKKDPFFWQPSPAGSSESPFPGKRQMRGRVAFPLKEGAGKPSVTSLPRDVDEMAVAGAPPIPRRRGRALRPQTEQLTAIRARKRRKAILLWGPPLIAALVGLIIYQVWSGPSDEEDARPSSSAMDSAHQVADPEAVVDVGASSQMEGVAGDTLPDAAPDRGEEARSRPPATRQTPPVRRVGAHPRQRPSAPAGSPEDAMALYRRGLQSLLRGQAGEAVRLFNTALVKNPRFSLAYRGLGIAYEKLGRSAMAEAAFRQYLSLNPRAVDAESIQQRINRLK